MTDHEQLTGTDVEDLHDPWPILEHNLLSSGRVCDFVRNRVRTPDGGEMTREYMVHPCAVAVMALDEEGRVAVVRQYRHPVGFRLIEPPAGLLDHPGEDYFEAAKRELAEEAMLAASDWRLLVDLFTTPGGCEESIRIYLATGLVAVDRPHGFVLEGEEMHMDIHWVHVDELVDAAFAGRVQSPSMLTGALSLKLALERGLDTLRAADSPWPAREAWQARRLERPGR